MDAETSTREGTQTTYSCDWIEILGVRIRVVTSATVCSHLMQACAERRCVKVYLPNAATLNIASADASFRRLLNRGDLVLRDGAGLQIAARLQGKAFPDNLVGTDLVPRLCEELGRRGMSVYLLGGQPGVPERAADKLGALCSGLRIAGCQHGFFEKDRCDDVIAGINAASPDLLLVAFGNPHQEQWIDRHASQLRVGTAIGVGGLFDHLAGRLQRAPLWMRKNGLEWLDILRRQPYKWRRYVLGAPLFLARIAVERLRVGLTCVRNRLRIGVKRFLRWMLCFATAARRSRRTDDKPSGKSLRILTYHDVQKTNHSNDPFCVCASDFRQQMEVLAKDWNVVALRKALRALQENQPLPSRAVAITFDDGYRGVQENAVGVLRELGLPATLFLRCDVLKPSPEQDYVPSERKYISADEARDLLGSGIDIGSHTLTHRILSKLSYEEARREILESKRLLEHELQTQIELFSYPYGTGRECEARLMRCVQEAGYAGAVTSINGANGPDTCVHALKRTKVEHHDSIHTFRRLLCGGMDCWRVVDKYGSILQTREPEAKPLDTALLENK